MLASKIKVVLRNSICDSCQFKRGNFKLFGITIFKRVSQCRVCKCSLYAKTRLKDTKCPKGKW